MRIVTILLFAALLLTCAARIRSPEYDEAYSIFLTAGDPRPAWPQGIFHPADVRDFYAPGSTPQKIAHDLRIGDVHPPLYFWALEYWRRLAGPSWFAARMLSVAFSVAALGTLAWLASLAEIPMATAMLFALLSYGFAYTGIVARGFALAQFLNILAMGLTYLGSKNRKYVPAFAGGVAFGAAAFSNYLAVFIGLATLFWLASDRRTRRMAAPTCLGLALFLPGIAYFFLAQRNARIGQFVAFAPSHAIVLLAKYSGAALFGGLPVYAGHAAAAVTITLASLIAICILFIVRNWQNKLSLFAIAAAATPIGLLALGLLFNNTPIEIRYLAFSMPFLALLLAQTLPGIWQVLVLGFEACGIAGLIFASATMQPQGLAARQSIKLQTPTSLVLLPFGNDGVGIPGPFIASAPDDLRVELLRPNTKINLIAEQHVILVTIHSDLASTLSGQHALTWFNANSCWVQNSATRNLKLFISTCNGSLNAH